jgi:uncharacterized glyoxalase superfamily protein PhnB
VAKINELRTMLTASDLVETIEFYTGRLGFSCTGSWGHDQAKPTWAEVSRDNVSLMFSQPDTTPHEHDDGEMHSHEAETPAMTGSIYLNVDDVDALFAEVQPKVEKFEWEPETFIYGMREFGLRDNNGYLLIFGAPTEDNVPPAT